MEFFGHSFSLPSDGRAFEQSQVYTFPLPPPTLNKYSASVFFVNESLRSLSATEPLQLELSVLSQPGQGSQEGLEEQCCHLGTPESSKRAFFELGCSAAFPSGRDCLPARCRCPGRQAGFGDGLFGLAFVFLQKY